MRRVLVTGSRRWNGRWLVWRELDKLLAEGPIIVVHGDCETGADLDARCWAEYRRQPQDPHPRDIERHGPKAAGPIRNGHMVQTMDPAGDVVLAFFQPGEPNKGTRNCVAQAVAAGLEIRPYGAVPAGLIPPPPAVQPTLF